MANGYFEMTRLHADGRVAAKPVQVKTEIGVLLQCPPTVDSGTVKHMCAMAHSEPNQPFDLIGWKRSKGGSFRVLDWSARLYWRTENV